MINSLTVSILHILNLYAGIVNIFMQFPVIFLFFMHLCGYRKRDAPESAFFMSPVFLKNAELLATNVCLMPLDLAK